MYRQAHMHRIQIMKRAIKIHRDIANTHALCTVYYVNNDAKLD